MQMKRHNVPTRATGTKWSKNCRIVCIHTYFPADKLTSVYSSNLMIVLWAFFL